MPATEDEIHAHFVRGVELFRDRRFFDSHEALEDFWNHQQGEPKRFTQGLIQAAVACHHLEGGNVPGAVSLYRAGREKLIHHLPTYLDIRVDLLIQQMDNLFGTLERTSPVPESISWPCPEWATPGSR